MKCTNVTDLYILINLKAQELKCNGEVYPISSSKFGIGTEIGSHKTPLGKFQISEKIGEGYPLYSVFRSRQYIGLWSPLDEHSSEDMILTRILRLSGLEKRNSNTYLRYIYIHGTNDENAVGTPNSIGCIRMLNADIINLYNDVQLGGIVNITYEN